jgi:hypothetical protein
MPAQQGTRRARRTSFVVPHPRVLAGLAATLVVLGGGFMLLRDSGLVAVRDVQVTGLTGPEAGQLVASCPTPRAT